MVYTYLEVKGSYNQAISVDINHELARLLLGEKYSYSLVIATMGLQVAYNT